MRALVLGANGMLGHKLYQELGRDMDVWGTVRGRVDDLDRYGFYRKDRIFERVDAEETSTVKRVIDAVQADVVINAIGVVKQIAASRDPVIALTVNSILPHKLAAFTSSLRIRLITISTDCVFSGTKGNYSESDLPDANDLYGISKRFGEPVGLNVLTLRTSIIGRELTSSHGLVEWFLSKRGTAAAGYTHAIFSGLTTISLASVLRMIINEHPDLSGLFHVSSNAITKHDLLVQLDNAFETGIDIRPSDDVVIDRSLDSTAFRAATGWQPPSWTEMIDEMAADPTPYEAWRRS